MAEFQIPEIALPVLITIVGLVILLSLVSTVVAVWMWCKMFSKAGFPWALGLLILVPIANMIIPFYLAFAKWPIHDELARLRARVGESG